MHIYIIPFLSNESEIDVMIVRSRMNLARPRVLPDQKKHGIKVHRSVKMRMEALGLKYKPKLKFDVDPEWVN